MSLLTINLDGGQTDAGLSMLPVGALFTSSGILRPDAFTASEQSPLARAIDISGSVSDDIAIIKTDDGSTYAVKNTATEPITIEANSSGVTKTDAIVLYVDLSDGDPDDAGSPGAAHIIAVRRAGVSTGLPTDGEIDAATSNNPWLLLHQVTVEHGAGEIEDTDLTDARVSCWFHTQFFGENYVPGTALEDEAVSNAKLKTGAGEPGGEWQDWTPSLSASGSMSYSSTTVTVARYKVIGKSVFFRIAVTGTVGGTPSNYLQFTVPLAIKTPINTSFSGEAYDGDPSRHGVATVRSLNGTTIQVGRSSTSSNWSSGSDRSWRASGVYETE